MAAGSERRRSCGGLEEWRATDIAFEGFLSHSREKRERESFFLPSPCEQTLSSFSKREDFLSLTLSEYTKGIEIVELEEEEEAFSQLHFAPCSRAYEQLTGLITRLKCPISCRK